MSVFVVLFQSFVIRLYRERERTCMYIYFYVCIYVGMYVCMYVCMCVYIYMKDFDFRDLAFSMMYVPQMCHVHSTGLDLHRKMRTAAGLTSKFP